MTARGTPSRFLQSVLHNGVGRYVCQLKRISLIFSKKGQGSLGVRMIFNAADVNCWLHPKTLKSCLSIPRQEGIKIIKPLRCLRSLSEISSMRDFIEEGVVDLAKNNPGTVVYISPQSCRIPKIVAEYLNGNVKEETVTNKTSQEITELITKLSNQSGLEIIRIRKPFHTDSPSIQGQWHPFTNRPPSIDPVGPQAK